MNHNQRFLCLIIGLLVCSSLVLAAESSPWKPLNLFNNLVPISPIKTTPSLTLSLLNNPKIDSLASKEIQEHPKEVELILETSDLKSLSSSIKSQVKQQKQISPRLLKIKIDPAKLKNILSDKKLIKIYANRQYNSLLEESLPLMRPETFWESEYTGEGIKIAILDTGLDSDHPMLNGKVILSKDFLGTNPEDRNGHGTHVAGIAAGKKIREGFSGVAPEALLINAKVLDDNGGGTTASIIEGINWAINPDGNPATDDGADILSLSLGAPSNVPDELINQALQEAINKGVKVVIASGNCGLQGMAGCGGYIGVTIPGSFQPAITVGSVNDRWEWQSYSSGQDFGNYIKPDVVAPGSQITSSVVNGYGTKSGTSMSTPFITGAIALILQKEGQMDQQEIKSRLEDNAVDMGAVGKDVKYGSGFVDLGEYEVENINDNQSEEIIINESEIINYTPTNFSCIPQEIQIEDYNELNVQTIQSTESDEKQCKLFYEKNFNESFIIDVNTFESTDSIIDYLIKTYTIEYFNRITTPINGMFLLADYNKLIWVSGQNIFSLQYQPGTNYQSLIHQYLTSFPSDLKENLDLTIIHLKTIEKQKTQQQLAEITQKIREEEQANGYVPNENIFTVQACSNCGDGLGNTCDIAECNSLGSCYATGCVGIYCASCSPAPSNGHDDYCDYKEQIGSGCSKGQYDCDSNSECLSSYLCMDNDVTSCETGEECGCCNSNEKWNKDTNSCERVCSAGYTGNVRCEAGSTNVIQKEYQNTDCSLTWNNDNDCDTNDNAGAWGSSYCDGSNIIKKRTYYNYSCSGGSCSSSSSNQYSTVTTCNNGCSTLTNQCYECDADNDCGTYQKCSSHQCVDKTCQDLGYPQGSCSNVLNSACISNGIYDCDDVLPGALDFKSCYVLNQQCTSNQYCSDDVLGIRCEDYPCTLTSSSWNQTTALEGRTVTLTVRGSNCDNSDTASIKIMEVDTLTGTEIKNENNRNLSAQGFWDWLPFNDDDVADLGVRTFSNGKIEVPWTTIYVEDSENPRDTYRIAAQNNQNNIYEGNLIITQRCHDTDGDNYFAEADCSTAIDCNDTDYQINPGKSETCDGKDNDCDGTIDEGVKNACGFCGSGCYKGAILSASPLSYVGGGTSQITVKFRNDGDTGDISIGSSITPSSWNINGGPITHNLATGAEGNFIFTVTAPSQDGSGTATFRAFWDGVGSDNHDLETKSYTLTSALSCLDVDNDGYGSNNAASCRLRGTDCDDTNVQTYPNATERCDNKDNDCDNSIDETFNLNTDNANCGSCGIACSSDRQCVNGRCTTSTGCTIPDGSSSECDCDSNPDCEEFGSYVCEFSSGWDACIQNFAPDECSIIDAYSCQGGNVYRCENVAGRKTLILSDVCTYNEICPANVGTTHQCQSTANYDLTLEYASSGTVVNKQPGDSLLLKVRTNSQATLEYNTAVFSGSCSAASGERTCLLAVKENAAPGKYSFSLNDDVETVRIIEDPYVLYVTNVVQLQQRFNDIVGVKVLLAKVYEKAGQNDGLVYDLGREVMGNPFATDFVNYKEKLQPSIQRNNTYTLAATDFVHKKLNLAKEIILVGDDYVVPSEVKLAQLKENDPVSGIVRNDIYNFEEGSYSEKKYYSDQYLAQRNGDYTFSKLDELFITSCTVFGAGDCEGRAVVFLASDSTKSNPNYIKLKDTITHQFNPTYLEMDLDEISCNNFDLFDGLAGKTLVIIGEDNPSLDCYPQFNIDFFKDSLLIEKNVWDKNSGAIIIGSENGLIALDKIIEMGTWRELKSQYVLLASSTATATSLALLATGIGAGGAIAGEGVTLIIIANSDILGDIVEAGNDCIIIGDETSCHISFGAIFLPGITAQVGKSAMKIITQFVPVNVIFDMVKQYKANFFSFIGKLYMKGSNHLVSFAKAIRDSGRYWDDVFRLFKDRFTYFDDLVGKGTRSINDIPLTEGGNKIMRASESTISGNTASLGAEIISGENMVKRGSIILKGENDIFYNGITKKPVDYLMQTGDEKVAVQVTRGFDSTKLYDPSAAKKQIEEKLDDLNLGFSSLANPNTDKWDYGVIHLLVPDGNNAKIVEKSLGIIDPNKLKNNKIVISIISGEGTNKHWIFK